MEPQKSDRFFVVAILTLVVGIVGFLFDALVGWDDFVEAIVGTDENTQLLNATSTTSPADSSTTSPTTLVAPSTTVSSANPSDDILSLTTMEPEDMAEVTSDLLATFRFIHSDLCLSSDHTGAITQETCEPDPETTSSQLWRIRVDTPATRLGQNDQCLMVIGDTEELDPMGNTLGELGLGSCEAENSDWRLGYVENRNAFAVLDADGSRCLDVLGGKAWTGQPVIAYPCLNGFDNQFVTLQTDFVSP